LSTGLLSKPIAVNAMRAWKKSFSDWRRKNLKAGLENCRSQKAAHNDARRTRATLTGLTRRCND